MLAWLFIKKQLIFLKIKKYFLENFIFTTLPKPLKPLEFTPHHRPTEQPPSVSDCTPPCDERRTRVRVVDRQRERTPVWAILKGVERGGKREGVRTPERRGATPEGRKGFRYLQLLPQRKTLLLPPESRNNIGQSLISSRISNNVCRVGYSY